MLQNFLANEECKYSIASSWVFKNFPSLVPQYSTHGPKGPFVEYCGTCDGEFLNT